MPVYEMGRKNPPNPFITASCTYVKDLRVVITRYLKDYSLLDKILSDLLDLPNLASLSLLPNSKIIELQTDKTFEDCLFAFFLCTFCIFHQLQ